MARKSDRETPRNVLIIRFSALGDVCMTIPVVYSVCRANPEVRFVYLTKKAVASLFVGAPSNLVVEGIDVKKHYHGPWGTVRLAHEFFKRYDIDAVADLHSVMRSHIIDLYASASGCRVERIDKMRKERQELISRGAAHAPALPLMTDRYADVFSRLGLAPGRNNIKPPVPGVINPSVVADVVGEKPAEAKWIAVAPFAAHRGKIYSPEKMREVVATLSALPATRVILFGGGDKEVAILSKWEEEMDNVISLAGKRCGFYKEMAIIGMCDVMVSMDSANMHLASLMGTPVVSVWGATHPAAGFSGWLQNPDNAVQADYPCRPCSVFGNKVCHRGNYECLSAITEEQIVNKVKQVIQLSD